MISLANTNPPCLLFAVHIADGQLNTPLALSLWGLTTLLLIWAGARQTGSDAGRVGIFSGFFFLASLLHVPSPFGAKIHLLLCGLLGIFLGVQSLVAIACGLALQAILFAHGGISSFGANLLVMGIPALISGWLFRVLASRQELRSGGNVSRTYIRWLAFLTGSGSVAMVLILHGATLWFGGSADWKPQVIGTILFHIPLAILEGLICSGVADFYLRVDPAFYKTPRNVPADELSDHSPGVTPIHSEIKGAEYPPVSPPTDPNRR